MPATRSLFGIATRLQSTIHRGVGRFTLALRTERDLAGIIPKVAKRQLATLATLADMAQLASKCPSWPKTTGQLVRVVRLV